MMWWLLMACSAEFSGGPGRLDIDVQGPTTGEARTLQAFDGVRGDSNIDVYVTVAPGPVEVTAFAREGEHSSVLTVVSDGDLVMSSAPGTFVHRKVMVRMPSLQRVGQTGSADVEVKSLEGEALVASVGGSGDLELHGAFDGLELTSTGSGDVEVASLQGPLRATLQGSGELEVEGQITAVEVHCSGSGDVTVEGIASEQGVEASTSGSCGVDLVGKAPRAKLSVSGSGPIDGEELTVVDAVVNGSGTGDIELRATGRVTGTLSGSGGLELSGGAAHEVAVRGSGKVSAD